MKLLGNSARGNWRLQVWFTTCSDVCASHWSAGFGLEGQTWKKSEALPPSGLLLATQAERIKWSRCFALGCKGWQTAASSHTDPDLWVCSLQESTSENPTFMFHIQTVRRHQPPWRRQRDSKTQKKAGKHHVVNSNSCELLLQKRCFKLHVVKVEVKGRMKRSGCCSERLHPTRPLTVRKPRQASVFPWIHEWDDGTLR